jgi:hypothetical protein
VTTPTLTVTSGPVDTATAICPCSRCGTHLPAEAFGRDRSRIAGRRSICRDCSNERSREVAAMRREGTWRGREYMRTAPIARLFERVVLVPDALGGCWRWTGPVSRRGYGQIQDRARGRPLLVHRVAYEWAIGPLADGLELDHLCETKRCVRPDHMEPLTKAEHSRRSCARLDQRRPGWRRGSR